MRLRFSLFFAVSLSGGLVPPVAAPLRGAGAVGAGVAGEPAGLRASFPVMRADHTVIILSAQAGSGETWATGHCDGGVALLRWNGRAWKVEERASSWPTGRGPAGIAADPLNPDALLTLWCTADSSQEKLRSRLQLRRHFAGRPAALVSDFVDPSGAEDGGRSDSFSGFTVDAWGQCWLTFNARRLVRVPAGGGPPTVTTLPESLFEGPLQPQRRLAMAYTAASVSEGWLWALPDSTRGEAAARGPGELSRPVRVVKGEIGADQTPPAGLPAGPRVTLIRPGSGGGLVWAVQGEGLWDVDAEGRTATRRSSPPDAWRIMDWRAFPDGTEVALVVEAARRRDGRGARIFVRRGARWIDTGLLKSGYVSMTYASSGGRSQFDWHLSDDLLVGAGFGVGLLAVDLRESGDGVEPRVRQPNWRDALPITRICRVHSLPSGEFLIQGQSSVVATPAELRAGWRTAERGGGPAVFTFHNDCRRAEDGRLWQLIPSGEGAPKLQHWDGKRHHEWPLPDGFPVIDYWPGLWVDALGRAAVFLSRLDEPAWERSSEAGDVWRAYPSGWKLIEARAADPKKAENVSPLIWERRLQVAMAPDGRALVGERNKLWLWGGGKWTALTKHHGDAHSWTYGFDRDGRPWSTFNGVRHVFDPDGKVSTSKPALAPRDSRMKVGDWPDWLKSALDEKEAVAARQDAEGVWWVSLHGELWKGWDGEVARVFAPDEPSPFRLDGRVGFGAVRVDATGARLFEGETNVLLPPGGGPSVEVEWEVPDRAVVDRVALVKGAGIHFVRWRLDGGEWRREAASAPLRLRELAPGRHVLEVVGFSERLEAGPPLLREIDIQYAVSDRMAGLVEQLRTPRGMTRAEAVHRLAAHGAVAEKALRTELRVETDDDRRWWLRAALQAIEDERVGAGRIEP